ncbi:MAG: glycoside hydrolase family 13 protein [Prevotella sp.]|jgi:glycosidase|nr:glycoside hydrolase family 13 protein [Prevotella sp.]MCH3970164.1 glycoside hydrolase family 13 protein [Prevotella sp.]MCH3992477.1 glycoside hydrolase family 13 protein [Prevotella sp.]MCH4099030.1 glycoside hydrolase family 13 protein [Prevotella sp.]MCH4186512.1 glycoside hydrolase family 13 protein [Prevotella sp.]MCH4216453.1 glycoside hydrolase family 13 protein [Prevotella sp.]
MKKKWLFLFGCLLTVVQMNAVNIDRIDPTDWFVGMKNPSLQLMVYGKGIRNADVSVDYPGVKIDSIVRLDSPDYLFVYLNLKDARAGHLILNFSQGRKTKKVSYELRNRAMAGDRRLGFTNADVLYMLMPDRFAQGPHHKSHIKGMNAYREDRSQPSLRHGGDLEGIMDHLDYFKQLGVTALWLTPVLENNSPDRDGASTYHGYATTDYYRIDPRLGTNGEYEQLVRAAHEKGLKVVMDMIFNHCGFEHPWVKDMPSKDWFNSPEWLSGGKEAKSKYKQTSYKLTTILDPYASQIDINETVNGWFVPTMPDLNQRNPYVMKYLIQNSEWWIETVGIDGIRMDTYPYADRRAMSDWMKTLTLEYPHFNVVGETWVTEPAYTAAWQKDSKLSKINSYLPTVMDFSFYDKINKGKSEETDNEEKGLNRVYNSLCYDYLYENPSSVMAFIENHDTDRFLGNGKDTLALKQALGLLLTIDRIPQLYYGTEVLMNGTKEVTDGNVRKDFPGGFPGDRHNCFTPEGRTKAENSMFDWLSRLLHWRQGNDLITKGKQTQFCPYNGVYVIARQYKGKTSMTILNGTSKRAVADMKRYAEIIGSHVSAENVITGQTVRLDGNLNLTPRQTMIVEF